MTVIVSDNEFTQASQSVFAAAMDLQFTAERLLACLDSLSSSGIVSDNITAALSGKKSEINSILSDIVSAVEPITNKTESFIENIDCIDSFLY